MKNKITKIFMVSALGVIIVADILLIAFGNESISSVMQTLSFKFPIIPFATGVLCGHFFWPVGDKNGR